MQDGQKRIETFKFPKIILTNVKYTKIYWVHSVGIKKRKFVHIQSTSKV